jgi:heme-degrading monooxygenase HmoA
MIQAYLILTPTPGKTDELIDEYRRAEIIEAGIPYGLQRGEAVRLPPADATPERLLITSLWEDQAAYDSWLSAPERVTVTVGVWPLLRPGEADAVHTVPRNSVSSGQSLPLEPIIEAGTGQADVVITVTS